MKDDGETTIAAIAAIDLLGKKHFVEFRKLLPK